MPTLHHHDQDLTLNGTGIAALGHFRNLVANGLVELEASLLGDHCSLVALSKDDEKKELVNLDYFIASTGSRGVSETYGLLTVPKQTEPEATMDFEVKRPPPYESTRSQGRNSDSPTLDYSRVFTSSRAAESQSTELLLAAEMNWQELVVNLLDATSSLGNFNVHPGWRDVESNLVRTRSSFTPGFSRRSMRWCKPESVDSARSGLAVSPGSQVKDMDRLHKRLLYLERKAYDGIRGSSFQRDHFCQRPSLIAHPYSVRRFIWGCLSLLFIIADVIVVTMTPFEIVGKSNMNIQKASDWAIACFWTMDIVLNFMTGFFHHGSLEMEFRVIALHYVRRWFAFDLFIVILSWLVIIVVGANVRTVVTTMRLGRLLRVMSLKVLLNSKVSVFLRKPLRSSMFVICLVVFVHVCACMWYYVGNKKDGWVPAIAPSEKEEGGYAWSGYLQSVRWAVAQLHGGMELEIQYTVNETLLEIAVNFVGILVMATFVSSLTNALAIILTHRKESKGMKRATWAYLRRHDISSELSEKVKNWILRQLKDQAHKKKFLQQTDKDGKALEALPKQLRRQLITEARVRTLDWHPVFEFLKMADMRLLEKVCCDAITQETFEENETVFYIGDKCSNAYFVEAGSFALNNICSITATMLGNTVGDLLMHDLTMRLGRTSKISAVSKEDGGDLSQCSMSSSPGDFGTRSLDTAQQSGVDRDAVTVQPGSVVSEAGLWMVYQHFGTLLSSGRGVLHVVNVASFVKIIRSDPVIHAPVAWNANRFAKAATVALNHSENGFVPDLFNFRAVLDEVRRDRDREHSERRLNSGTSTPRWTVSTY